VITVKDLVKMYGPTKAVDHVSFEIAKGEIIGLLGPNGAGKTSTMKIITGAMPATSGSVSVAGFDVYKDSIEVKKRVGYLPEVPPLYPEMPVRDYLIFAGRLAGIPRKNLKAAVEESMRKCQISHVSKRLIRNLSKGYRQRVGLAQAIVHSPDLLVLDEPTVGLDPRQIIEIRELIKDFAKEHTVILSSHILPEVSATCERVLIINDGKIVADDKIENIQTGIGSVSSVLLRLGARVLDFKGELLNVAGVEGVEAEIEGETTVFTVKAKSGQDPRGALARAVVEKSSTGLLEMRSIGSSLEEVFLKLTRTEPQESVQ